MTRIQYYSVFLSVLLLSGLTLYADAHWKEIEKRAQNTVVQVWVQATKFEWLEPYRAPKQQQGAGSAFFIDSTGKLLTNFHVVDGAKYLFIMVPALGQELIEARVRSVCPEIDVALIEVTPESKQLLEQKLGTIPFLPLGDSDTLYRTQRVLALGYPLGQRYLKSTLGEVAGGDYAGNSESYIHITAPINPGNSGGPLLDEYGYVVGINSAGVPNAQNVGFIRPINSVKVLMADLERGGLVRKPSLGILWNHATVEHARSLNNPTPGGVYIYQVVKGSLAAQLNIQEGDMWYGIQFDEVYYAIDEHGDVSVSYTPDKISIDELLLRISTGTPVTLVLYRNGERQELTCAFKVTDLPAVRFMYPDYEEQATDYEMFGGLVCMQLCVNHFHKNKLPKSVGLLKYSLPKNFGKNVVVITHILRGSPCDKVRCFYPGAVIDSINGQQITTLAEVRAALMLSAQTGTLTLVTKDRTATVLSLSELLKEEPRLARDFMFSITPTMQELWRLSQEAQQA
jgi:serine protease Do